MKTLDEVIKAMNWCTEPGQSCCSACPYADDDKCYEKDALHYLKVLKDILDPLNVKKISHEITCPQCKCVIAILFPESNEPLTWQELRQMEGKPVWVELKSRKAWGLLDGTFIDAFGNDCITIKVLHDLWHFPKKGMGKDWQAYRKERE